MRKPHIIREASFNIFGIAQILFLAYFFAKWAFDNGGRVGEPIDAIRWTEIVMLVAFALLGIDRLIDDIRRYTCVRELVWDIVVMTHVAIMLTFFIRFELASGHMVSTPSTVFLIPIIMMASAFVALGIERSIDDHRRMKAWNKRGM